MSAASASGHRRAVGPGDVNVHMSGTPRQKADAFMQPRMTHMIYANVTERCCVVRKTLGICVYYLVRDYCLQILDANFERPERPVSRLPTFLQEHFNLVMFIKRFARDPWCCFKISEETLLFLDRSLLTFRTTCLNSRLDHLVVQRSIC